MVQATQPSSLGDVIRERILAALAKGGEVQAAVQAPATDLQSRLKQFAQLANWQRELDECLKFCKSEMDRLEKPILEEMALQGLEHTRVDGLTIYPENSLAVSKKSDDAGVTTEVLCARLQEVGLGYLVKDGYNAASLKSKVKEWLDEGVEVPAELAACLNILTITKLRTRK